MNKLLTFLLTALLTFSVGWAATVTDVLTRATTGVTGTSYTEWSGKTATSTAVYAGQSAGGNESIQLRSSNSNSGVITTASGGKVKSITVEWDSQTSNGRTLNVYGKNTAYSKATDLYNASNQGTLLGTIVKGTSTSLTISGDYEYIGFRSASGAMYLTSVTIEWETGGSATQTCETPTFSPAAGTYTEAQNVTISCATSGANIYYTTDGSTPSTSNGTVYSGAIAVNSNMTIKAIATASGYNNSTVAEASYIINSGTTPGSGTVYRRVNSTADLVAGQKYIIVYEDGNNSAAMGAFNGTTPTTKSNFSAVTGLTVTDHRVDIANANGVLELILGGSTDAWTLFTGEGYISGVSGAVTFTVPSTVTGNAEKWTISSEGVVQNNLDNTRYIRYYTTNPSFRYYTTSNGVWAYLYVQDSNPALAVSETSLALADIPYDAAAGATTSGTITVTGSNLEGDVSVSVTGDGFSVQPTTISPVNGSVNQDITVTYSGTSTSEVTGTVTITCGDLTRTVTVTAKKQTPPPAVITVDPSTLTINDSGTGGTLTITGQYVNGNINASLANNADWYLNPATFSNTGGTASVTYTGRALSASNTVTAQAANDNTVSAQATVNYQADLYIVTDNGVTNQWDFNNGVHMTYSDGVYTGEFEANQANTFILFARKLGNDVTWNTRLVFGPDSNGDWLLPADGNGTGTIDLNDDDPIKIQYPGVYHISINASTGALTITSTLRTVETPTFSPAPGSYTEAQTVTISCATDGATISYSTDDGATWTVGNTLTVSETTTILAKATKEGMYDSETASATYTIRIPGEGDFVLVTEASELAEGDEIIFVNTMTEGSGALAMSTTQNANNRGTTMVTVEAGLVVADDYPEMQVIVLESVETDNTDHTRWYLNVGNNGTDAYLCAASSSSNYLRTQNSKDANAIARILFTAGVPTIQFTRSSYTHDIIRFNGSIVSCYESGQAPVYIYKRATARPSLSVNPTSLDLVIPAGGSQAIGTATVTERNTTGTTTITIDGDANVFAATLADGTLTVTYSGNASADLPDGATIILTNGDVSAQVAVTGYKIPMTLTISPATGYNFTSNNMSGTIDCDVADATIEYSFDQQTWYPYQTADGFTTPDVTAIGGTVTVYARATYNGETVYSQATYTRADASATLYTKVTSADQIQAGLQYILVHEAGPDALNNFTSGSTGGTGVEVVWETENSVVDIAHTDAIQFTLSGDASAAQFFYYDNEGTTIYLGRSGNNGLANEQTTWALTENNGGYSLTNGDYSLRYNTGMTNADKYRCYNNSTGDAVYLYVQGMGGIATPKITPASGNYGESQTVTMTCATPDATIYYTVDGGETQTYSGSFTATLDENHRSVTIEAWAEKDGETSNHVTVTYNFKSDKVYSIAEFLALDEGEEVTFESPVTVLFDYSQNSSTGQEYIWVKDRTGYTQFFISPQFKDGFIPKYENGDVIPAGFKVKKGYYDGGGYIQAQCYEWHETFQDAQTKALADPEQVLLSDLLANPGEYNNRYLYINKLQVSQVSGLNFRIATDENGDGVAEVQGGSAVVGYNKYNSPAWKNKQGDVVGVTLPNDDKFYNVTFIFQQWQGGYEIMPIQFTEWKEDSLRLEDLVKVGVEGNPYTISNPLIAAHVTWDDNKGKFAIFAKDDEMYAEKRYPLEGQQEYTIDYVNQDGTIVNTVEQKDYDQSNWVEILIPSGITGKTADVNAYQDTLRMLQERYVNKILVAGTVSGSYVDDLNPTIDMGTKRPSVQETGREYKPNFYCTANFLAENIDDIDGAMSYRNDDLGGDYYFFMDAKPQEFCQVVWAYYTREDSVFVAPAQEGDEINGHRFKGSFAANMSLCEDYNVTKDTPVVNCFTASNTTTPEKLYGFEAIVRKNPEAWGKGGSNGAPRRIQPYTEEDGNYRDETPLYIVYPLSSEATSNGTVTAVTELVSEKTIKSVRYYNMMGMESETPFEGINIVVTYYTDGTRSTAKVLR